MNLNCLPRKLYLSLGLTKSFASSGCKFFYVWLYIGHLGIVEGRSRVLFGLLKYLISVLLIHTKFMSSAAVIVEASCK
jgi:hypothetical protein